MIKTSPSKLITAERCLRAWFREHILGEKPEYTPAQLEAFRYGTEVHAHFEEYLKTGKPIKDRYMAAGLPFLDTLKNRPMIIEERFKLDTSMGVKISGIADALVGNPLTIVDHKTTSNPRWIKTDWEVRNDFQTICYGRRGFELYPDETEAEIIYHFIQKPNNSKPPKAYLARAPITREEVDDRFANRVEPLIQTMLDVKDETDWREVEGAMTPKACDAFGGCPYKNDCYKGTGRFGGPVHSQRVPKHASSEVDMNAYQKRLAEVRAQAEAKAKETAVPPKPEADLNMIEEAKSFYRDGVELRTILSSLSSGERSEFMKWVATQKGPEEAVNPPDARPGYAPGTYLDDAGNEITEVDALISNQKLVDFCLMKKYHTLEELCAKSSKTELVGIPGVGEKAMSELLDVIEEAGLTLELDNVDDEVEVVSEFEGVEGFTPKAIESLKAEGILEFKDFWNITLDDLLELRGVGKLRAAKIQDALSARGISLKGEEAPEETEETEEAGAEVVDVIEEPGTIEEQIEKVEAKPEPKAPKVSKAEASNVETHTSSKGFGLFIGALPIRGFGDRFPIQDYVLVDRINKAQEDGELFTMQYGADKQEVVAGCIEFARKGKLDGSIVCVDPYSSYGAQIIQALGPIADFIVRAVK